jgi:hypothetical protein
MAVKSKGRGTVAAFGLFLLFAGLVGGGVLYVVAQRRPGQVVDGFARAPIGCTTTLEFTETGVFYVYEEAGAKLEPVDGGCRPVVDPELDFNVDFTGDPVPESVIDDDRVSYDVDGFDGRAVQRIEIDQVGTYSIAVRGEDVAVVAAIGRNPNDGVNDLRWWALLVATSGAALGILLLVLAGRRSKLAATVSTPVGPGWGPGSHRPAGTWPPQAPRLDQIPINPHQPSEPAAPMPPPPPLPERSRAEAASWGPPGGDAEALPPPDPNAKPTPPVPGVTPVLPDAPGRPSGT